MKSVITESSLLGVAIIWALNFSVIKITLTEIDPYTFNAFRYFFACLVLVGAALVKKAPVFLLNKDTPKLIGIALIGNVGYQVLFIVGIDLTYASNAAVILGTIPIWISTLAHFFTDEKLTRVKGVAILTAFSGVVLIILSDDTSSSTRSWETLTGDVIILLSAITWAAYTLLSKKYLKSYSTYSFSAFMSLIGFVTLSLIALPFLIKLDTSAITLTGGAGILYSGVLSVGVSYIVWNVGLVRLGAVRTAAFQNLVPVFGLFFGILLMDDPITFLQITGAVMVIIGIILARY
ncbi:MAG: DMT family transporter [Bacteroidota bacterium]